MDEKDDKNIVISFMGLRKTIGILGIALPILCFLFGLRENITTGLPTISDYYYTEEKVIFAGILISVGLFLISYRGYDRRDFLVALLTGICAIFVAVFPCHNASKSTAGILQIPMEISGDIHLFFAATFFTLLAYNSIFLFTLTQIGMKPSREKLKRNKIYRLCGFAIFACLGAIGVLTFFRVERVGVFPIKMGLEAAMLLAFGSSWLVKGEAILKDRDEHLLVQPLPENKK